VGTRQPVSIPHTSKVRVTIFAATAFILAFAALGGAIMMMVAIGPGIEPAYAASSGGCSRLSFKNLDKSYLREGNNFVREVSVQTTTTTAAGRSPTIGIDYAIVENDDGNSYYKSRSGVNPSDLTLAKGSMIKIGLGNKDLTNIDQIRSVTMYRTGVPNCSILLGNVDSSKMMAFEKVSDDQFLVPATDFTAKEFGKFVVQVEGNDEFEEFYITSNRLRIVG
jgi:hypothetical protein